jgi:hypothetical protein
VFAHSLVHVQAVRVAPQMGCALPKHLVHNDEYMSPAGPGTAQAASCNWISPQYQHVHFARHVLGLVYTKPVGHSMKIDTAHTGLHMDPIGAACVLLGDDEKVCTVWLARPCC